MTIVNQNSKALVQRLIGVDGQGCIIKEPEITAIDLVNAHTPDLLQIGQARNLPSIVNRQLGKDRSRYTLRLDLTWQYPARRFTQTPEVRFQFTKPAKAIS